MVKYLMIIDISKISILVFLKHLETRIEMIQLLRKRVAKYRQILAKLLRELICFIESFVSYVPRDDKPKAILLYIPKIKTNHKITTYQHQLAPPSASQS